MPNTKTPLQYLSSLISRSPIVSEEKKNEFLNLLPSLTQDQMNEVTDFFLLAENKIKKTADAYGTKTSELYTSYLPQLNQVFQEAHKLVLKTKEEKSLKGDEKNTNALLEELDHF